MLSRIHLTLLDHPGVTLCSWQDVKFQLLSTSLLINSDSSGRGNMSASCTHEGDAATALPSHAASQTRAKPPVSDQNSVGGGPAQGRIPEGSFSGQGRHKDGGSLGELLDAVV